MNEQQIERLKGQIDVAKKSIYKLEEMVSLIEQDLRKEYFKSLPGVEGIFDGTYLISDSEEKIEVPANYAAKSKLCYGDVLKLIEEDGKKVFKQVNKSPRKKLEGVLSKKEGKWFILTPEGTYKISDIAAEYNQAEINDKGVALVPENNTKVPFAALESIEGKQVLAKVTNKDVKTDTKDPKYSKYSKYSKDIKNKDEHKDTKEDKDIKPVKATNETTNNVKNEKPSKNDKDTNYVNRVSNVSNENNKFVSKKPIDKSTADKTHVEDKSIKVTQEVSNSKSINLNTKDGEKEFIADITLTKNAPSKGQLDDDDLR